MINELYNNEEFYFKQDQASPNYVSKARRLRDEPFLKKTDWTWNVIIWASPWIGRIGAIDWQTRSPGLTPHLIGHLGP